MSTDFKQFFNREDKADLLEQIKNDLTNTFYGIDNKELEYLTENIYEYSCLLFHRIYKAEITKYITEKNKQFYDSMSEKEMDHFIDPSPTTSRYLEYFIEKYRKTMNTHNMN